MPQDYKIELVSPAQKARKGVEYELRITRYGISVIWNAFVEEFVENELFRDRQAKGPFSLWVHTHKFEDHGQGTLITDLIEYDLPFGIFGKLAEDLFLSRDLQRVFDFRHRKIQGHFTPKTQP